MSQSQVSDGLGEREKRQKEIIVNDILSEDNTEKYTLVLFNHFFAESLQPYFPSIVENVTVSHGRKAILKCEVENLRNYKVLFKNVIQTKNVCVIAKIVVIICCFC